MFTKSCRQNTKFIKKFISEKDFSVRAFGCPLATSPGPASAHGDSEGNIVGCFSGSVCSKICYIVNLFYYFSLPCLYGSVWSVGLTATLSLSPVTNRSAFSSNDAA